MPYTDNEKGLCEVTKKELPVQQLVPLEAVRKQVLHLIRKDHPEVDMEGYISAIELSRYRYEYVKDLVEEEFGELSTLEQEVLESVEYHDIISKNVEEAIDDKPATLGERWADNIAEFGGSWKFIMAFAAVLFIWICVNIITGAPFDPYPFILLNLVLSCLAAIQAPLIMMSQNRQEAKDRMRSESNYQVSLKMELEIKTLNEKIDHIIQYQNQQLVDALEAQMTLIEELRARAEPI